MYNCTVGRQHKPVGCICSVVVQLLYYIGSNSDVLRDCCPSRPASIRGKVVVIRGIDGYLVKHDNLDSIFETLVYNIAWLLLDTFAFEEPSR